MTKTGIIVIHVGGGYTWFVSLESYKEQREFYCPASHVIKIEGAFKATNLDPETLEPKPIE